jgi:16S rRNA U1498 N3-methylase RsmE
MQMKVARYRAGVNLLLLDSDELRADGTCRLTGRRARHLREVLGAVVGSRVRAGVVGASTGSAEVTADDGEVVVVQFATDPDAPARPPLPVDIVLAVPRPKVIARAIETCAAFGVRDIALTNAWRVDKSYLRSPRLAPDALALAARLGAEQGATTHVPPVTVHPRLMALLDARFAAPQPGRELRLVAHPHAPPIEHAIIDGRDLRPAVSTAGWRCGFIDANPAIPLVLAFGPEGGWIARELDTLVARGFAPVSLGAPILRVESAIAAALGQVLLLRRLAASSRMPSAATAADE